MGEEQLQQNPNAPMRAYDLHRALQEQYSAHQAALESVEGKILTLEETREDLRTQLRMLGAALNEYNGPVTSTLGGGAGGGTGTVYTPVMYNTNGLKGHKI